MYTPVQAHIEHNHINYPAKAKKCPSEKLKWMNEVLLLKTAIQIISVPHANFISWGLSLAHSVMVNSFCGDFLLHAHAIVGEWGWEWGKQVGGTNEESQARGCYNILFTPTRQQCRLSLEINTGRNSKQTTCLCRDTGGKGMLLAQGTSFNTWDNWGHKIPTQSKMKKDRKEKG